MRAEHVAKWEHNATASVKLQCSSHLKGLSPLVACKLKVGHPALARRGRNDVWAESATQRICIMVEKMQT